MKSRINNYFNLVLSLLTHVMLICRREADVALVHLILEVN